LIVDLKYHNGLPVIKEIKRVSKPGRRIYARANSIPKIQNGFGVAIVSTSIGIMSDNDARMKNVGVLFSTIGLAIYNFLNFKSKA